MKSYNELIQLGDYESRLNYLRTFSEIGDSTFGYKRFLNQAFYLSREWLIFRRDIIIRDNGCDMALKDLPISGKMFIHHINPIDPADIQYNTEKLLDPNNVVLVSFDTHNLIHFGTSADISRRKIIERTSFDTCPWK